MFGLEQIKEMNADPQKYYQSRLTDAQKKGHVKKCFTTHHQDGDTASHDRTDLSKEKA